MIGYVLAVASLPLVADPRIGVDRQRRVLLVLADHANGATGLAYPAVATIAARTQLPEWSVRYALRALEAQGVIEPVGGVSRGRRPTRYRLLYAPLETHRESPRVEDGLIGSQPAGIAQPNPRGSRSQPAGNPREEPLNRKEPTTASDPNPNGLEPPDGGGGGFLRPRTIARRIAGREARARTDLQTPEAWKQWRTDQLEPEVAQLIEDHPTVDARTIEAIAAGEQPEPTIPGPPRRYCDTCDDDVSPFARTCAIRPCGLDLDPVTSTRPSTAPDGDDPPRIADVIAANLPERREP